MNHKKLIIYVNFVSNVEYNKCENKISLYPTHKNYQYKLYINQNFIDNYFQIIDIAKHEESIFFLTSTINIA